MLGPDTILVCHYHFIVWKESFFGVPVHSVSPHFIGLFPLQKYLGKVWERRTGWTWSEKASVLGDSEEENNQCKFKSPHLLLGLWGAAAIIPPSLFSELPPWLLQHTPIFPFSFTTFFSWWKSSLRFVCPAINFSCFNTRPYFPPGNSCPNVSPYHWGLKILAPGNPALAEGPCHMSGHSDWLKNGHMAKVDLMGASTGILCF